MSNTIKIKVPARKRRDAFNEAQATGRALRGGSVKGGYKRPAPGARWDDDR